MNVLAATLWTLGLVAAITWSALCSGTEIGCYSLNRVRLDARASDPRNTAARLLYRELQHPDRNLVTLLVSNNIANYAIALCATGACLAMGLSAQTTGLVSAAVLTPLTLIFGEALPKEVFRANADRLVYAMARPLNWSRIILTAVGVHPLVSAVARLAERLGNLRPDSFSDARQRVAMLFRESVGTGVVSSAQAQLADRALAFGRVSVADEMTPWSLVRTLSVDADHAAAVRVASLSRHARLPVVDPVGRVIGVLRTIDVFLHPGAAPRSMLIAAPRVRAHTTARDALLMLRESEAGLAIVEDDNAKPLGIVTAKDLIEPLTGELPDL